MAVSALVVAGEGPHAEEGGASSLWLSRFDPSRLGKRWWTHDPLGPAVRRNKRVPSCPRT